KLEIRNQNPEKHHRALKLPHRDLAPTSEPRTPNPEPRTPNPEPLASPQPFLFREAAHPSGKQDEFSFANARDSDSRGRPGEGAGFRLLLRRQDRNRICPAMACVAAVILMPLPDG